MKDESGWNIDVSSLSEDQLSEVLKSLKGSKHLKQQLKIKKEIIRRTKESTGWTDIQIANKLVCGTYINSSRRKEIEEDWAEVLGFTISEFIKITE